MTELTSMVDCPRCGRATMASWIWIWVNGQGERITVDAGRIKQSGHATLFDLACGCKFDTELWRLSVSTSVSTRSGGSVSVLVTPLTVIPDFGDG